MDTIKQRLCGMFVDQTDLSGKREVDSTVKTHLETYFRSVASEEKPPDSVTGVCPEYGGNDGGFSLGQAHWYVCNQHRLKWLAASGLWPTDGENQFVRRVNERILRSYNEVLSA